MIYSFITLAVFVCKYVCMYVWEQKKRFTTSLCYLSLAGGGSGWVSWLVGPFLLLLLLLLSPERGDDLPFLFGLSLLARASVVVKTTIAIEVDVDAVVDSVAVIVVHFFLILDD